MKTSASYTLIKGKNFLESYHDAVQSVDEALNLFNLGYLSIELRAVAEQLFWAVCGKLLESWEKPQLKAYRPLFHWNTVQILSCAADPITIDCRVI